MPSSRSTDKLDLLVQAIDKVPVEVRSRVKTVKLTWTSVPGYDDDVVVCPNVEIELYPPAPTPSV